MKDIIDNLDVKDYHTTGLGDIKAMARIRHAEANSVGTKENEKPCETASSQGL